MSFLERLLNWFKPQIISAGSDAFAGVFNRIKDPKVRETVLVSIYSPTDVYLEELVKETKTELDDAFVAALKQGIEKSAAANNISLPNLDND